MLENNASVKDMEAAAVAYIAEITNTPFFALKGYFINIIY